MKGLTATESSLINSRLLLCSIIGEKTNLNNCYLQQETTHDKKNTDYINTV
jgi:hypothetical protein